MDSRSVGHLQWMPLQHHDNLGPVKAVLVLLCWGISGAGCAANERIDLGRPVEKTPTVAAPSAGTDARGAGTDTGSPSAPIGPSAGGPSVASPTSAAPLAAAPVVSIDDTAPPNPAGLSSSEVDRLRQGGPIGNRRFLYPYEGTVFPRGTLPPVLMWESDPAADAFYVRIRSRAFDYQSVLKPSLNAITPGSPFVATLEVARVQTASAMRGGSARPLLEIPRDIWARACQQSQGKSDLFTIEVTERANGNVAGPFATHILIAPGSLLGSVYYQNWTNGLANVTGRVMRVPPGGAAQDVVSGDVLDPNLQRQRCPGCHSVSSNGARLIVQWSDLSMLAGSAYSLDSNGAASMNPESIGQNTMFAALYPDGSKYLTSTLSAFADQFVIYSSAVFTTFDFFNPEYTAQLHDAKTGAVVPDTGIPNTAVMPMFSVDGSHLVFNDAVSLRELALMDYDTRANKASNYRTVLREDPSSDMRPGWPFLLPDNRAIVYARTDSPSFTGTTGSGIGGVAVTGSANVGIDLTALLHRSDLYIVDVRTGTSTLLAKAMGFAAASDAADDKTYLPFGPSELHHNFMPTLSPVAQGGYFWLFFSSVRNFGHLGLQRQLWVAAIDVQPEGSDYSVDVSHPPFYLPGQSFGIANHRAFATLDACKPNAAKCTSGIECCPGTTCYFSQDAKFDDFGNAVGSCEPVPPQQTCARLDERCNTAADCCDASHYCINSFCAFVDLL